MANAELALIWILILYTFRLHKHVFNDNTGLYYKQAQPLSNRSNSSHNLQPVISRSTFLNSVRVL